MKLNNSFMMRLTAAKKPADAENANGKPAPDCGSKCAANFSDRKTQAKCCMDSVKRRNASCESFAA